MPYYDKYQGSKGDPRRKQEQGEGRREHAKDRDEQRARTQDEKRRERFETKPRREQDGQRPGRYDSKNRPGQSEKRPGTYESKPRREQDGQRSGYHNAKPRREDRPYDRGPGRPAAPVRPAPSTYHREAPAPQPAFAPEADLPRENLLVGRNPIREAIKSGRDIEKLLVARGELSGSAQEIVMKAKERHVVVQEVDRSRLDAIAPGHQGMLAFVSAYQYSTVEHMLALAKERNEPPFLILLDSVTDPHNLGAVIRTAECAGAHGVIIPERRAVGLTPAVVKAAAGAVEYLPVARVSNLVRQIEALKAQGIWVYGATMEGQRYDTLDLSGPVALVIGSEGEGISRLALERCDGRVSLPIKGKIDSLNASVAAGILMYEVLRRRMP